MKPVYLLIVLLFRVSQYCFSQTSIIPTPESYQTTSESKIAFSGFYTAQRELHFDTFLVMNQWLKQVYGKEFDSEKNSNQLMIEFQSMNNSGMDDKYNLSFDGKSLVITFSSEASKLYAFSTLLQLIEQKNGEYFLQPFSLSDHAQFPWRGLHLDVCRHFFTIDEVKRYIDIMAFYKFNKFHWHLTDDQGWRIEIKKYPLLTEIGGYRDSTLNDHYNTVPRTWNTERYGGFYTQEQIKDVINYAEIRGITIVPEIEMPGHARAALAAYPQYSCTGKQQPVTGLWGVFDDIFCSKEETILFLQDVLTEVLELFPSEYIHIGGDEAPKTRWKACENCQNNIKKYNLKDEHELQSWFIRKMDAFLTEKGRKLIGWDEILEGGLSPNAAVMSWRGEEGGIAAANEQHEVVMTPGSHCYFDHYQGESQTEPLAFGGYTPLEKVYNYDPIPKGIAPENRKYILGAQANLWTEYIPDFKQVEYMVYPRALAMIQNTWSVHKPDYDAFIQSLKQKQFKILKSWNINYSLSFTKPIFHIRKEDGGISVTTESIKNNPTKIIFSPTESSSVYLNRSKATNTTYRYTALEEQFSSSTSINIINHKGIGLDIEFLTPPNKRYSYNLEVTLVDGILGARPWNGSQWLGFNSGNVECIVHLDKKINYKYLTVNALNVTTSWIHLPESIVIYSSKDGKEWKQIAHQEVTGEQTRMALKGKNKLLKVVFITLDKIPEGMPGEGHKPFTFLDELIFE